MVDLVVQALSVKDEQAWPKVLTLFKTANMDFLTFTPEQVREVLKTVIEASQNAEHWSYSAMELSDRLLLKPKGAWPKSEKPAASGAHAPASGFYEAVTTGNRAVMHISVTPAVSPASK